MKFFESLQPLFEGLSANGITFDKTYVHEYLRDRCGRRVPMTEAVVASAKKAGRGYIMADDLLSSFV